MLEITRTVRFCLGDRAPDADAAGRRNTYSAWPPPAGLPRYYELLVTCRGEPDEPTGYLINIKAIDDAVRTHALPLFHRALGTHGGDGVPLGALLRDVFAALAAALPVAVARVTLRLTPLVTLTTDGPAMPHILLEQQYEFSAAHRLHVDTLSDEQNRATFGKCNNPAGHGHNYRLAVSVRCPVSPQGHVAAVAALDDVVARGVIDHLDHKHLNRDVPAFAAPAGVNPSVEHIAAVIWEMLTPAVAALGPGVALDHIRVWETEKTCCTYRGPAGSR